MVKYTITTAGQVPANLHLIDSYKESKRLFKSDLLAIKASNQDSEVWMREICGMKLEWACHNALYHLHIARERTKDCDLNAPQSFLEKAAYSVLGILVWPFIP